MVEPKLLVENRRCGSQSGRLMIITAVHKYTLNTDEVFYCKHVSTHDRRKLEQYREL